MWQVATLNEAFLKISGRTGEVYGRVRALATALAGWGVGKGDRVALLSENRWEWPVTDFAVLALGAVDVPLYLTLTAQQVGYMMRDSGAKVAVVSNREQYDKLVAAGELPELEQVVVMDAGEFPGAHSFSTLMEPAVELRERDAEFDARVRQVKPKARFCAVSSPTAPAKGNGGTAHCR